MTTIRQRHPQLRTEMRSRSAEKAGASASVIGRRSYPIPMIARCACGGHCPQCRSPLALQTSLAISQPGDVHEQEADAVAAQVMRMPESQLQRQCACGGGCTGCTSTGGDGATSLQMEASSAGRPETTAVPSIVHEALRAPGQSLDSATRNFMEPRFGHDFQGVRIHAENQAHEAAQAVNALAFTVGQDVVFGAGQYGPGTDDGRRLLAHELVHVVQQTGSAPKRLARTVSPTSFRCPANTNNAPADPFAELDAIDRNAQGLAEAAGILAIIASVLDPSTGISGVDRAYQGRFGVPTSHRGGFRNRFTGALLPTQQEAAQEEIIEISNRFDRLRNFLGGPIRYTCQRANVAFTHSNCVSTCGAGDVAFSCVPQDQRRIEICPDFWGLGSSSEQAIALIHEAVHMLFNFRFHGSGSQGARGRNPECYASFVADLFGITPFDLRCPQLP